MGESVASDSTLSLYFDLKEGRKADLEIVAQAAIKWVSLLRLVAQEVDPHANVKVELVDAIEGSLKLNTVIEWVENQLFNLDRKTEKYKRLRLIAVGLALYLGSDLYERAMDYLFDSSGKNEIKIVLDEKDRNLLRGILEKANEKQEIKQESKNFFRVLEHDTSIAGVGISKASEKYPKFIIPNTQFAELGGLWELSKTGEEETRTVYHVFEVILISPVLIKKPRCWKFQISGLPEFSAKMEDKEFLKALEQDHIRERLRVGINMTIRLKIIESLVDGEWSVKNRSVIEVISPKTD
ncbi:MAG: Hypothetical protein BHV28_06720 [Candidatus Tokpelaia hoelldobleri]|uniref:Uncharacterized protein n=1 Tax=Candidatus Tokpelaia hoelldobleri TaxID=1902579 RepID=A0A1U9JU33_9HYPH|nr:MAG: Hypothetical protein BHV28_06720 [Candidatus Tokpelaia hoelldoblerii]